jgi:uncharacterized protein (TIGR02147 family)
MADIFSYTDYRLFIKDHCNNLKKTKPFFSYRYIAQKAGLKSAGFISWVVSGKRTMSMKLAHKITTIFKLGKRETEYFLLLVQHNQSTNVQERQHACSPFVRPVLQLWNATAINSIPAGISPQSASWSHSRTFAVNRTCFSP